MGGIAVIFFELLCWLSSDFVQFLHLKPVSSWQFPDWICWFSQLLHCLLSAVKISRFPHKKHLNSLLHAFLKATCPQCLDDSHYLLWPSTMPVTNINGTDVKQEAKNRSGLMFMLREFSKLERKVYRISLCIIFPTSSSTQCYKHNISIQAKKTNTATSAYRSSLSMVEANTQIVSSHSGYLLFFISYLN